MIKNAGIWAGAFLLAFSGLLFQQSLKLDYVNSLGPGPGFLPLWLSGLLFVVTLFYLWDSLRNEGVTLAALLPHGKALPDIVLMLLGLCLFALLVERIGFVLAGTQLVFLMTVRNFKWDYALCGAALASIVLLLAFQKFLGVALPVNEFGW